MTIWSPGSLEGDGPRYLALADALARDIEVGRLQPGDRLPTHRALARALGVNVVTVTRGYAEAARRGLVDGEVGRGTFVRARRARGTPRREAGRDVVDFDFNLPAGDPDLLDVAGQLRALARDPDRAHLFTGYTATGLPAHRAAGARWIGRAGLEADPERVLVCGGVQHGLTVVLASLAAPGDVVLTEDLTYPGLKALATVLHLRPVGVAQDGEGLDADALASAVRRTGARVLYTMPTVHNPTGVVMTAGRREAVAAVVERHGLTVVEDATYAFACADAPPPLAALLPEHCVHLVGTAKSLAAGLRVGYLLAPAGRRPGGPTVERLAAHVAAVSWMAAPLQAELAARFIDDGSADAMVAWKRREAAARRRLLRKHLPEADGGPSHPASGHVWLSLPAPWRWEAFVEAALRRGVAVTPSEAFVVGRAEAPHAVRVCLATPAARADVERGLAALAGVLAEGPQARAPLV